MAARKGSRRRPGRSGVLAAAGDGVDVLELPAGVVAAAVARPEGDGIEVLVPPVVADAAGGAEQALAGIVSPFPLFAEVGEASAP